MLTNTQLFTQSDRGLNYGDGCFTTIAFSSGKLQLLDRHFARLRNDCERLSIPFTEFDILNSTISEVVQNLSSRVGVIKVLISRGEGGRGYDPSGCANPVFSVTAHPFPERYSYWQQHGISLGLASLRLGKQPLLAGLKHLNRLEQVLIKQELSNHPADDLLVLDSSNHIIEASASNVFWFSNKSGWFTPDLEQCGVAGVMRGVLLEYMHQQQHKIQLGHFYLDDLLAADAVFICNCLMGIVPVNDLQIDDVTSHYNPSVINYFTSDFSSWLKKLG